jgi:hypothetical protein
MAQNPAAVPLDTRLTTLLEIEQRLEAEFREAERVARAQVEAAHEALRQARDAGLRAAEAAWTEEVRADTEVHQATLRGIEAERVAGLEALRASGDADLDALAGQVLARLLEPTGGSR